MAVSQTANAEQIVGPGQYEATNPALDYEGGWSPDFDPRASTGEEMIASGPSSKVTLRFSGDAVDLILHKIPNGGQFEVKLDGSNVNELPRDSSGRSYLALSDANEQWQVVVQVARHLTRGPHSLELMASGSVNLDGFIIPQVENPGPPWILNPTACGVGDDKRVSFVL